MEQVQFDTAGFAIASGFITVYTTDNAGVFTGSEEQWISEGCGLAANAYLEQPPVAKQSFAIIRGNDDWEYIADFRGKTFYDKTTKAEVIISELGEIPENLTALKPESELCEWNGSAWVISSEKQAELKAQQQEQVRQTINDLRDKKINGGVYVPEIDKWIDSDARAERNLLSTKASFDLFGDDLNIVWTCADNTTIKLDKAAMLHIWLALMANKQQNHANALAHKNAVEQSENPLEYDYSAGWTTTYADFVAGVQNG